MNKILTIAALLLSMSGPALAGSKYDECIKEEKALKTQEAGDCNGLKYLLNPNACFATQKLLKVYTAGKCRTIGQAENVDFSVPKVTPEKNVNNAASLLQPKTVTVTPSQGGTLEQLKEENTRLKAENSSLKAENELLRKAGREPRPTATK